MEADRDKPARSGSKDRKSRIQLTISLNSLVFLPVAVEVTEQDIAESADGREMASPEITLAGKLIQNLRDHHGAKRHPRPSALLERPGVDQSGRHMCQGNLFVV